MPLWCRGGAASSSLAAALRALGERCVYLIVIVSDAWPRSSGTSTGFTPRIIECDARCDAARASRSAVLVPMPPEQVDHPWPTGAMLGRRAWLDDAR